MPWESPKVRNRTQGKPKINAPGPDNPGHRPSSGVPLQLQQKALNIFRESLNPTTEDQALLQEVKGHLFKRDFETAFGRTEYLRVYASRWSPSRALGYLQVYADIEEYLYHDLHKEAIEDGTRNLSVMCVGGGAGAEIVGLGAWLHLLLTKDVNRLKIDVKLLDIASWDQITTSLHRSLVSPPALSKYASAASKANNDALLSEDIFRVEFVQQDVLTAEHGLGKEAERFDLVTIMFTLNELYSTSVTKTQQMLADLTSTLRTGSLLLVVDSPGSYSTVTVNNSEKRYPMQWLLDFTLLASPQKRGKEASAPKWEKLVTDDSRWFRVSQELRYPIDLENMRYQIHLYRRLPNDQVLS